MLILLVFAFIAGFVTILSPCILPIVPIVLSGSLAGGKQRPLGVIVGFILSFTFFATFSFVLARAVGLSTDTLRGIAVVLLILLGFSLFSPRFQMMTEKLISRLPVGKLHRGKEGFLGGLTIGLSLGIIWTPCVGPILASVITLAASSDVTLDLILITLAYSSGTALPLFAVTYGGSKVLTAMPVLRKNATKIQKAFGVLIFATSLLIFFNVDRTFQAYILKKFPSYGTGLTKFEDNDAVKKELLKLENRDEVDDNNGKRMHNDSFNKYLAPNRQFNGGGEWLNSEPLTLDALSGKVVLIDFWTYSCINCIRTFPYIQSWYEKYKDDGFVIIGVHTPEFEFERETKNVQRALEDFGLTYPVVQDNEYMIWGSYDNRYWPAHYLIDKDGFVRYTHFGEGNYDVTESKIRELLVETGNMPKEEMTDMNEPQHTSGATPEIYLGLWRLQYLVSPERPEIDKKMAFTAPKMIPQDRFTFEGSWDVSGDHSHSFPGSKLRLRFYAKDVFLVMAAETGDQPLEVYLDGQKISPDEAGEDVKEGIVTVNEEKLYRLIKLDKPAERELLLEFPEGNIQVYAFTFG